MREHTIGVVFAEHRFGELDRGAALDLGLLDVAEEREVDREALVEDVRGGVALVDEMTEPGPSSAALLGLRVAVPFGKRLAIEGEAVAIPTDDDVLRDEVDVYGLRAHARFDLLTGRLKPFLVVGAGAHVVRSDSPQMDDDTDRAYHWGGGARFAITDKLDARLDIRHLIVPDRTKDGATSDAEVTAGVTYRFGGKPKPRPLPPPIVVEPEPEPEPPPPPPPPKPEVIDELAGIGRSSARRP